MTAPNTKPAQQKKTINSNLEPRASRLEEGTPAAKSNSRARGKKRTGTRPGRPKANSGKQKRRGDSSASSSTGKRRD